MEDRIVNELVRCSEIVETNFRDMMEFDFTVENGKLYLLSARPGKRTELANLKIVMSMFCEGKINVEDVIKRISSKGMEALLDEEQILNIDELSLIGCGLSASGGVGVGKLCFSLDDALFLAEKNENFIFCKTELNPEDITILNSKYCKGVITERGGMTSHAAVVCRGMRLPCVAGVENFKQVINEFNNVVSIDGYQGKIYSGIGQVVKINNDILEVELLYRLLLLIIKNNIITAETAILVWRLWDVVALHKKYRGINNSKRLVSKHSDYLSFQQPSNQDIESIKLKLQPINNGNLLVEDLSGFLLSQLSAHVPLGSHYLYVRPLLDPTESMFFNSNVSAGGFAGTQLTGVEFYHVNRYVDFLLDIYSIKIYFTTNFNAVNMWDNENKLFEPLNFLDFTNPNGESLIINTYNAKKIAVYINDALIPVEELPSVYHLIRRRKYFWTWYKENNITKLEVINYLNSGEYRTDVSSKYYFLCEEMHLIHNKSLTKAGISILGGEKVRDNRNIDYILNEVVLRGYNNDSNECNDFLYLIQKKDFKNLIALELYECYFWNERHEFDLQLLNEIVESVSNFFSDPETIRQIEFGIVQTLPSAIIISLCGTIWSKLRKIKGKRAKDSSDDESSSWVRIEKNVKMIDKEFQNHDYILSDEIEHIFGTSREEIQPLLKLCGCKCYINKNRNIWIKAGTNEARIKAILKKYHFKYK